MPPLHVPRATGDAALAELDAVDWTRVAHAYGTGPVMWLGSRFDVERALRDIAARDPDVAEEAILSFWDTLCHQGTIYEASARAVPFLAAWLAGADADDSRADALVQLVAAIAAAACLPEAPDGSRAGAWGSGVRTLTRTALAASLPPLEQWAARVPRDRDRVSAIASASRLQGSDTALARRLSE